MVMLMNYPDVLEQSVPTVKDRKFHMNTEIHPFMQQLECCLVLLPLKPLKKIFKMKIHVLGLQVFQRWT